MFFVYLCLLCIYTCIWWIWSRNGCWGGCQGCLATLYAAARAPINSMSFVWMISAKLSIKWHLSLLELELYIWIKWSSFLLITDLVNCWRIDCGSNLITMSLRCPMKHLIWPAGNISIKKCWKILVRRNDWYWKGTHRKGLMRWPSQKTSLPISSWACMCSFSVISFYFPMGLRSISMIQIEYPFYGPYLCAGSD